MNDAHIVHVLQGKNNFAGNVPRKWQSQSLLALQKIC